jgi:hypothetical protein
MTESKSIHPRVVGGRTAFEKVNTSKHKRPETTARLKAALTEHLSRHPQDHATAKRLAGLS